MTEPLLGPQHDPDADGSPADVAADQTTANSSTGHPEVDAVVSSLDGLDEQPVADHVAVFEQAHEALRRTLAGPEKSPEESPVPGED